MGPRLDQLNMRPTLGGLVHPHVDGPAPPGLQTYPPQSALVEQPCVQSRVVASQLPVAQSAEVAQAPQRGVAPGAAQLQAGKVPEVTSQV